MAKVEIIMVNYHWGIAVAKCFGLELLRIRSLKIVTLLVFNVEDIIPCSWPLIAKFIHVDTMLMVNWYRLCIIFTFNQGNGNTKQQCNAVSVLENAKQICAGYQHSLILNNENQLFVFGRNANGQLVCVTSTKFFYNRVLITLIT